ncbi:MAG: hypothetical protein U1F11_06375 [Steroidobacteraceae bacterium]
MKRIVELRARGEHAVADRELDRFRQRHPDYVVPREALRPQANP